MGQSWYQLDWVWTATGWTLAAIGGVLLVWGLFWDRSRGRRRCPKCWYDMAGVPGLRCPECGRVQHRERRFARTRRKWRAVAAALPVLVLGIASIQWPRYAKGGWVRIVPSSVLVFSAPTNVRSSGVAGLSGFSFPGLPPPALSARPWPSQLCDEAWRRLEEGELWRWQSQIFVGHALTDLRVRLEDSVFVADRWVRDLPVPTYVEERGLAYSGLQLRRGDARLRSGEASDKPTDDAVGMVAAGDGHIRTVTVPLRLWCNKRVVYTLDVRQEVTIAPDWSSLFVLHGDAETSDLVRIALDPRLCIQPDGDVSLVMDDRSSSPRWQRLSLGMGCRFEVLVDGKPAAAGIHRPEWSRAVFKSWEELRTQWAPGMRERARAAPESVVVQVRGDSAVSGEIYGRWPFVGQAPECWTGSFTLTPRVVDRPEKFTGD